jgi:glycosyltransferase involved in cell wall biosynthesis
VDIDLFKPSCQIEARKALGLPLETPLILFPSLPSIPIKRFALAAQAACQVKDSFDAKLVVVGNVDHHLMPVYMNACDVLLVTSIHEGSPTVVKEALACNLPIVAVDVGDIKERTMSVSGCYICENNEATTVAAALRLALSPRQRTNGRHKVAEFEATTLAMKVISVYERALARESPKGYWSGVENHMTTTGKSPAQEVTT